MTIAFNCREADGENARRDAFGYKKSGSGRCSYTARKAGEEGVEPPLTVLETAFLPLEDSP